MVELQWQAKVNMRDVSMIQVLLFQTRTQNLQLLFEISSFEKTNEEGSWTDPDTSVHKFYFS